MSKEEFSFPEMKVRDLLEALKEEFGFLCTAEDLSNPTAALVERLYVVLGEHIYRERNRGNQKRIDAKAIASRSADLADSEDTLAFVIFWRRLRTLMQYAYVNDFTVRDLEEPDGKRLRKFISGIVNFMRHKTVRHEAFAEFLQAGEQMRISADNHRFELESLEKRADELEVERAQNAGRVEDEKHQQKLTGAKLQEYRSQQGAKQAEIDDLKNREESLTDACTALAQKRDALTKRLEDAKSLIISPAEDLQKEVADNRRRVELAAEKADVVQAATLAMTNRTALLDAAARKLSSMDVLAAEIVQAEAARKDVEHKHLMGEQNFAQLKKKVEGMRSLLSSRNTSLKELEKAHHNYHGKVERDEQKQVTDQKKIKDEIMGKQAQKHRYVQQISDLEKAVLSLEKAHVDLDAEMNASREQWRTREIKIAELKDAYSRRVDVEIIQRLPNIEWKGAVAYVETRGTVRCASPSFGGGDLSPPPRTYPSPPQMPSVPAGARAEPGWRMLTASPSGLGLTSPGPQSPGVGTPVFSRGTPHRLGQGLFSPSPRASPGLKAFMSPSTSMRPMIISSPGFMPPPRASAPRSRGTPKPLRV